MATRTVVCPDCSERLTLGRLSCSNCGSLLASVAGAPRRVLPLRTVVVDEPAWLSDDDAFGWVDDEAAGHDARDEPEPRPWHTTVTPPRPEAVVPPVLHPEPSPTERALADHAADAVLAEPESAGAPDAEQETEPEPEPESEAEREPDAASEPEPEPEPDPAPVAEHAPEPEPAVEPDGEPPLEAPAATTDPVPDPESSPDVEPADASSEGPEDEAQRSWVDLRVAAVSGGDPSVASAAAADETSVEHDMTADAPAPDPAESPVEPDVPAAEPVATVGVHEEPGASRSEEPVGAPGDVDDAAEPPPPDVVSGRATEHRSLSQHDDEPARPLHPSHSTWSRLDLSARPVAGSVAPPWEPAHAFDAPAPELPGTVETPDPEPPAGAWVPPAADVAAEPAAHPEPAPRAAARRSDLKLDAPDDLPSGFAVVGSGIATLGFLLPWAAALPGSTGWTARWGLAEPSHGLVFLAAAALLGFNVVPNRVPAWIRAGSLPLGLGGLLLGLVWPAMVGGSGMQLGAVAVTFAALVLVAGGVVGVSRARQEGLQAVV